MCGKPGRAGLAGGGGSKMLGRSNKKSLYSLSEGGYELLDNPEQTEFWPDFGRQSFMNTP